MNTQLRDLSEIYDSIKTKDNAMNLVERIDSLSNSLFNIKGNVEEKLGQYLPEDKKQAIYSYCLKNNINTQDAPVFQKFLQNLREEIAAVPSIKIYLASSLPDDSLRRITQWFVQTLKRRYFLDVYVKPEIMGGVALEFNGLYKDYSLRRKMVKEGRNKSLAG